MNCARPPEPIPILDSLCEAFMGLAESPVKRCTLGEFLGPLLYVRKQLEINVPYNTASDMLASSDILINVAYIRPIDSDLDHFHYKRHL